MRRRPARGIATACAIVALHAAVLLLVERLDRREAAAPAAVVYTQLLLPPAPPRRQAAPQLPARTEPVTRTVVRTPEPLPIVPPTAPASEPQAPAVPADWAAAGNGAPDRKLDVTALVAAAGENDRTRRREPLEQVRESQRVRAMEDSDAARAIRKTGREDCTKKYAGGPNLDPLKLIPLLYDTVTNTGCKW